MDIPTGSSAGLNGAGKISGRGFAVENKKPWWYGYGAPMSKAAEAFLDFQFARKIERRLIGGIRSLPLINRRKL
jgi:hypothetical protein